MALQFHPDCCASHSISILQPTKFRAHETLTAHAACVFSRGPHSSRKIEHCMPMIKFSTRDTMPMLASGFSPNIPSHMFRSSSGGARLSTLPDHALGIFQAAFIRISTEVELAMSRTANGRLGDEERHQLQQDAKECGHILKQVHMHDRPFAFLTRYSDQHPLHTCLWGGEAHHEHCAWSE